MPNDIQVLAQQVEALTKLVASLVSVNQASQPAKQAAPVSNPRLASKDQQILRGFKKKGIKDVVLMDRSNRSKPFNVKPFKAWLAEGRIVRKGEHGVKGLFHITQTDKIAAKPQSESVTVASTPKAQKVTVEAKPQAERPILHLKSFQDLAKANQQIDG